MKIKLSKKDVKKFKQLTNDFMEWMKEHTPEETPNKEER